ncbi:hypothetical protein [Vibrio sp. 11986-1-5]|uniref:hypothetical protein n=1 Tax=Vibrio sp. 11986-1-5 TaxID=2211215 RepID=UPI000D73EFB4|nr:hypothetical protein [Vibrio sp. 11986-1-5]PXA70561.1 hypothetical protein DMC15_13560 [Vibrio sp. 11986-1-5]
MVKRLCKLNRHDIRASLGDIHRLVAQTNYVCGSCARSSAEKGALCKPQPLLKAVKQSQTVAASLSVSSQVENAVLTPNKKTLKKQKKYQKKIAKVLKKQRKLLKKQHAINAKFAQLSVHPANPSLHLAQVH